MSVLEVAEPESHIFIIVLEIIRTFSVLLVLQPLTLVAFAVGEGVDAVTASFSLQVGTLVGVAVGVDGGSLALRLSAHHLALILSAVAGGAGTERDFLGRCSQGRERQQQGDHQGLPAVKALLAHIGLLYSFVLYFMPIIVFMIQNSVDKIRCSVDNLSIQSPKLAVFRQTAK